jgi:hypothetical protein
MIRPIHHKICGHCGSHFYTTHTMKIYCMNKCNKLANDARRWANMSIEGRELNKIRCKEQREKRSLSGRCIRCGKAKQEYDLRTCSECITYMRDRA